jgi:hypothetical protein
MRTLIAFCALAASLTAAQACPDYELEATFGDLELVAGFLPDPTSRPVGAGGSVDLSACSEVGASGYVAEAPDIQLTYSGTSGGTLTITAISFTGVDLILIVNDPNGDWHTDDDSGFSTGPTVTLNGAADGVYDIWVGTYTQGAKDAALLMFTEFD